MGLLILYGVLSIAFSFLCSILEAVLLSVTTTFINVKKDEGKSYAQTLEDYKKNVDEPLIAILTINTIAHTVGAILVGSQAKTVFEGNDTNIFIISSVMTILILVVSEIIPKTIGATYWKQLAGFTATSLKFMMFPLKWTGILWLLGLLTKMVGKSSHGSVLSRQDFAVMTTIGAQDGALKKSEYRIINNLLRFDNITAKDIMTPRTVVIATPKSMTLEEFYEKYPELQFSRIPIYENSKDHVIGFFLKDDLLLELAKGDKNKTVESILKPIEMVEENSSISKIFNLFLEKKIHLALVIDEYGGTQGVVSMEDVMETLLGLEIMDEYDNAEDMQKLARQKWRDRAKKLGLVNGENESGNFE